MKAFPLCSATILLILCVRSTNASLEEICRKAALDDNEYNFCVSSLQVDPKSRKADTQGLALIATALAKTNFTKTVAKIKELLTDKNLPGNVKSALEQCSEVYDLGIDSLQEASDSITSGDIHSANIHISAASDATQTCPEGFKERGIDFLLAKENDNAWHLTSIAIGITKLLK